MESTDLKLAPKAGGLPTRSDGIRGYGLSSFWGTQELVPLCLSCAWVDWRSALLLLPTHARINEQIYAKDSSQIGVLKAVSLEPAMAKSFRFKHTLHYSL